MPFELTTGQRFLLQRKIHVAPDAYANSNPAVRARFPSGWSAAIETARLLEGLPEIALLWWAQQPNGHLLLTLDDDSYAADFSVDGKALSAVAGLPLSWLLDESLRARTAILRPLDHLLGCGGAAKGGWLSDGGGISRRWQQIGGQIADLFVLGYGRSEASRRDPHSYLAEGLALLLADRQQQNSNDPKLERLLLSSLLSEGFWRHFQREYDRERPNAE